MCSRVCLAWRACSSRGVLRGGLDRGQVGVERHLRVDHDQLPARQPHEHVRPQPAVLGVDRRLLDEIAVGHHARQLDHPAQLDLAPGAARLRALQRRDELAGLLAQGVRAQRQRAHHLRQLDLPVAALALQAPQLALDLRQLLVHRPHHLLELLRAQRHLPGRALLLGAPCLGQPLRERIAGLGEHVGRDRLQFVAQALAVGPDRGGRAGGAEDQAEQESEEQQQHDVIAFRGGCLGSTSTTSKNDMGLGRERRLVVR